MMIVGDQTPARHRSDRWDCPRSHSRMCHDGESWYQATCRRGLIRL